MRPLRRGHRRSVFSSPGFCASLRFAISIRETAPPHMNGFEHIVRSIVDQWGYIAIFGALLRENAGVPLPGETILVLASFLAHKGTSLDIQWVILVGIAAAVIGDNLGFLVGRCYGSRFLLWLRKKFHIDEDIDVARYQIRHHGRATVFWAATSSACAPSPARLPARWK